MCHGAARITIRARIQLVYDIQYQTDCTGTWANWHNLVNFLTSLFTGQYGHSYCFRSRAYDLAGNVEDWPSTPDTITHVRIPTVRITDVFTTDESGTAASVAFGTDVLPAEDSVQAEAYKTEFNPGDPIQLYIDLVNELSTDQTATIEWRVTDPNGELVPDLSSMMNYTYGPGGWWHQLNGTVPLDSMRGDYTFEGFITYNGETTTASTTFHVNGVGITAVFTTDGNGTAAGLSDKSHAQPAGEIEAAAYTTDFNIGDPIQLYVEWVNDLPTTETITVEWYVENPAGQYVPELSWVATTDNDPGGWWWWITSTIPADSLTGDYTFIGVVTHNDVSTYAVTTFHVNGLNTVKVIEAYTTDEYGEFLALGSDPAELPAQDEVQANAIKTEFNAGDPIRMYISPYNNVAEGETAYFEWVVIDPWGRVVPEMQWYGDLNVHLGRSWWWLSGTIPSHAVTGTYTFSGWITHNGMTTYDSMDFYVYGPPRPVHEDFNAARLVNPVPYLDVVDTWNAYTYLDDPEPSCGYNVTNTIWYRYVGDGNPIAFYTNESDFDTVVSIWTGTRGNLAEVACNDDGGPGLQSFVKLNTAPGNTYYIMVGGYGGATGLLQFEATHNLCDAVTDVPNAECQALVSLYSNMGGSSWTTNFDWLETPAPCDWYGVECNANHVTGLYLSYNHLTGSIPAAVGSLPYLEVLELAGNELSGNLPPELGNLNNLYYLWLSYNQLGGSIPSTLGNLSNLEYLYLWDNQFNGSIPSSLGNLEALRVLSLGYNQLNGSFPTSLTNLTNLEGLYLNDNYLSGSLPASMGNLPQLTWLQLGNNQFSGTIPSQLGNLTSLQGLYLYSNSFTSSIPPELGNLSNLHWLNLGDNQLNGSIPPQLGALANLEGLYLYDNALTGSIPTELGNLNALLWLNLANNQLTGPIPASFGNLGGTGLSAQTYTPTKLEKAKEEEVWRNNGADGKGEENTHAQGLNGVLGIWLYNNQLTGLLPGELGNLSSLIVLDVERNHLSGVIPASLGNLTALDTLWLSSNQLTGALPAEWGSLTNLTTLHIENNGLEGEIPVSIANLDKLGTESYSSVDFGYNKLMASNPTIITFLNGKDPDWDQTQTVPPANVQITNTQSRFADISWTPILYTGDGGYYEAGYSETPGGPYAVGCTTTDKTVDTCTVTDLTPGTTYYFAVRTYTPGHGDQQNDLWSAYSPELSAATYDWSFTVNVMGDDDDGSCLPIEIGDCTLREAINDANDHPGADTIDFVVSGTITLGSELPTSPPK